MGWTRVADTDVEIGEYYRYGRAWSPSTDRNALADVIGKLTIEKWIDAERRVTLDAIPVSSVMHDEWNKSLLTCDPAVIARAIAEVVDAH